MKKTVVLTSRENFVWLSMQEIIPGIEKNWIASASPGIHEVLCFDIDKHTLSELMPHIFDADTIVLTCFTVKLIRVAAILRSQFGLQARYIIYLHNQATIACWPIHEWGLGELLREDDVFIASCSADARAMRYAFKNSRTKIIPFSASKREITQSRLNRSEICSFVYVGRISSQKNLHSMLYAFRLFLNKNNTKDICLHIYGKDDSLGSPNMGSASTAYGEYLKRLCRRLEIEEKVVFHGHKDRKVIERQLAKMSYVFVSASLHSDENFGMSPFHALCSGKVAVLTKWGGYADFGKHFPGQVFYVKPSASSRGPWISALALARQMQKAIEKKKSSHTKVIPKPYLESTIIACLRKIALEDSKRFKPLLMSALAKNILRQREKYKRQGSGRIFQSYSDPSCKPFFSAYGAFAERKLILPRRLQCVPWVLVAGKKIKVNDPHRGQFQLNLFSRELPRNILLCDSRGVSVFVHREIAMQILRQGYAHAP